MISSSQSIKCLSVFLIQAVCLFIIRDTGLMINSLCHVFYCPIKADPVKGASVNTMEAFSYHLNKTSDSFR